MFDSGGFGNSSSSKKTTGGPVSSSDSLANNNAYASAPVFNINDERKGSGKYVTQMANNYNLSVQNTDYGAIGGALNFAGEALDFGADVLGVGAENNLEFLGAVSDFSDSSMYTAVKMAEIGERQTENFLDYTAREAENNRDLLGGFSQSLSDAYLSANQGLESLALDMNSQLANNQNSALDAINSNSVAAQSASMKALDYVFESTKSAEERTAENSTKWILGAVVVAAAIPLVARFAK